MAKNPLTPDELARRLTELPGWEVREGRLHRVFEFDSFARAFGFMAAVAIHAQEMNHHPDWSNSYTRVTVDLVSHDAGGITERDLRLAAVISRLFED